MERNNLDELLQVLETIRAERYPDISSDIVREIVFAQYDNQSEQDRIRGRQATTQIVMRFLENAIKGEER